MSLYSYKYRLVPTTEQEVLLAKHFGCVRWVYNEFLAERMREYKTNKRTLRKKDNETQLPVLKLTYAWLKEVGSQSLQYAVECLQDAYSGFFGCSKTGKKLKKKRGFPKFKKRHGKQSFRVKQNIKMIEDKLVFPKFLEGIKFIKHREAEGEIQFATVSKNKTGQYHVSITVEREMPQLPANNKVVGIDLNVVENVDSDGEKYTNPRPARQYAARLKLLHQRVARSKKGTNGRREANHKLAKVYLKVHNKREDFLHKLSRCIINENQVVCVEDLSVESMLEKVAPDQRDEPRWKERRRHRDIADCGWSSLLNKLEYKARYYGREFVQVSRWYPSSQLCNHCGWRYKDLPKDCKEWCCWNCWETNQRDENSAKNLRDEGLRLRTLGTRGIAACPDVRPAMSGLLVEAEAAPL
ncbi:MAG: RNA-guided endonuclease TnpB family protein [Candidatus Dormibacteria bacterium]